MQALGRADYCGPSCGGKVQHEDFNSVAQEDLKIILKMEHEEPGYGYNHPPDDFWTPDGHIHQLAVLNNANGLGGINLDALRKVWAISDQMKLTTFAPQATIQDFGGGWMDNLDLEAEWQRVVDFLQ